METRDMTVQKTCYGVKAEIVQVISFVVVVVAFPCLSAKDNFLSLFLLLTKSTLIKCNFGTILV